MSLVRGVHEDPTRQHLIRSLNTVCRDLGIRVVAEGVETRDERDTLIALGSDLMQGYLFGKPASPYPDVDRAGFQVPADPARNRAASPAGHEDLMELRDSLVRLLASLNSSEVTTGERIFRAGELGALGQRTLRCLDSVLRADPPPPASLLPRSIRSA
jgi:hypothetical protein